MQLSRCALSTTRRSRHRAHRAYLTDDGQERLRGTVTPRSATEFESGEPGSAGRIVVVAGPGHATVGDVAANRGVVSIQGGSYQGAVARVRDDYLGMTFLVTLSLLSTDGTWQIYDKLFHVEGPAAS